MYGLQFSDEARDLNASEMCTTVAESLGDLMTIRLTFINSSLFYSDLNQLQRIHLHWSFLCLMEEQRASSPMLSQDLRHIWNVTDLLLNSSETFFHADGFFRYYSDCPQTCLHYKTTQGRHQVKQSRVDSTGGCGKGVPPKSGGRVCGYNLKLISTLHNDSIPETPSGKRGVDVSTPVQSTPRQRPETASLCFTDLYGTVSLQEENISHRNIGYVQHRIVQCRNFQE